jgi:two-component system sensor histidine kinase YesM
MRKKFFVKNLIRLIVPLLIPLIILGSFSIITTQRYIKKEVNNSNYKTLEQTKSTVELLFNEQDSLHYTFNYNSRLILRLKSVLRSEEINQYDIEAYGTFMNMLNSPANIKPYIHSIYLYYANDKGNFLASNEGITNIHQFYDTSWLNTLTTIPSDTDQFIENRSIKRFPFDKIETEMVTIYKKIYVPGSTKTEGYIVMNIKRDDLEKVLKDFLYLPHQAIFLINQDGRVISSSNQDQLDESKLFDASLVPSDFYETTTSNERYIVSSIESPKYKIKYITVTPEKYFYQLPINLMYVTITLVCISLLLGFVLAYYVSRKNYNNLVTILLTIDNAERGQPIPELTVKITDEYSFILQNMIKTFIEQSYLKIQLSEKRYRLQAMEMMALQSNINPHFLANTLRTIFWKSMGLTGGHNEVSKMIDYLSEVVQYSISNANKTVTLEEEIFNTNNYIEILNIRYKDKFRMIWQYDEAIIRYKVVKLLFQPLIENSIYHGIKESDRFGYIKIKIRLRNSKLHITIMDTGIGMKRNKLRQLRQTLHTDEQTEHIGLFNTCKRLQLMFEENHQFIIRSKSGYGTMIDITFPAVEEDPTEELWNE